MKTSFTINTCHARFCTKHGAASRTLISPLNSPARRLSASLAQLKTRRSRPISSSTRQPTDFAALLSKPSWSVRSLLPSSSSSSSPSTTSASSTLAPPPSDEESITPNQLHHLLRLSALPQPRSPEEESDMIRVLQSQLHFVRDIQSVDTSGVEPLRSIRDETREGLAEATIGLETLREALAQEDVFGHSKRPRRRRRESEEAVSGAGQEVDGWDPLQTASRTAGGFFVVRSGKE